MDRVVAMWCHPCQGWHVDHVVAMWTRGARGGMWGTHLLLGLGGMDGTQGGNQYDAYHISSYHIAS